MKGAFTAAFQGLFKPRRYRSLIQAMVPGVAGADAEGHDWVKGWVA